MPSPVGVIHQMASPANLSARHPDYSKYSFWLESCGEDLTPRPTLQRSDEVDVAIVGAGYTGLWTAYYLLRSMPKLKIAVLEKEIVGFGASGRNGGWCSSRFPVTPSELMRRLDAESARTLQLAMYAAVDEVGRTCEQEGIDAQFHKGGILSLARGSHQLSLIRAAYAAYERLGLSAHYRLLSREETLGRLEATQLEGSLYTAEGASVHPGRLVRGLARAVERRGATIYEQTNVTGFSAGPSAAVRTAGGELRVRKALVLAGEAYLTRLSGFHRALVPMYSLITLTEPLSVQQWKIIGWRNRESIASNRYSVDYMTRTADGRILFGSRGAPYLFGSKISDAQDIHAPTHHNLQKTLVEWFPFLEGIRFTHNWGGPVGMPRDWMPSVDFDASSRVGMAIGFTGQGVSTSNLAARILNEMITGNPSSLSTLPMVHHRSPKWEREPLRWMAVRYMQNGFSRIDSAVDRGESEPVDAPLLKLLGRH